MPITIKSTELKYKNPSTGQYQGIDAVAETTTSQQCALIEAKGAETIASIPSDYTTLSDTVDDLTSDVSDLNGALNQLPYYQNDHSSVDCAPLVYTTIAQISITAGTWIIIGSHEFGSAFTENYQDYVDDGNGIQIAIARNLNGSGGGGAAICGFYVASTDTTINYKTFHFHTDGNLSARRIKFAAIKIHN